MKEHEITKKMRRPKFWSYSGQMILDKADLNFIGYKIKKREKC